MTLCDTLNLDQYVALRKLMSDISWYRKTERIDELSVQVEKHSNMQVFLHCNDKRLLERLVRSTHKVSFREFMLAVGDNKAVSDETLDTIKIWMDTSFYTNNPKAFELLLSSTFNDEIVINCGPLKFSSADITEEEAEKGDTIRRMLYGFGQTYGEKLEKIRFVPYFGKCITAFNAAYESGGSIDLDNAFRIYDMLVIINSDEAFISGKGDPYKWENDRYSEYIGMEFDEEQMVLDADGSFNLAGRPSDNCLAAHMSKLSYSDATLPWETKFRNEFLRKVFDAVLENGSLPEEVSVENGLLRVPVREFVSKYGHSDVIPVLDAAFFLHSNKTERNTFLIQQKYCDRYASTH